MVNFVRASPEWDGIFYTRRILYYYRYEKVVEWSSILFCWNEFDFNLHFAFDMWLSDPVWLDASCEYRTFFHKFKENF